MAKAHHRRRWEPGAAAFDRLLAWLDGGVDSKGERYLDVRERLVHYFSRRNCSAPDDLADETLDRVARRLEETGSIDDIGPAHYCYIVARFVWLEALREQGREAGAEWPDRLAAAVAAPTVDDAPEERERTLTCLERCLDASAPSERQLILDYYGTAGSISVQRKQLALKLGLTSNSLAIRACRIRSRLERCVRACLDR